MAGKGIPEGPTAASVRDNIAKYRAAQGISYAELSRTLSENGRPIAALGLRRIESGERRVDADDLVAIAIALGVNPNALIGPSTSGLEDLVEVSGARPSTVPTRAVWSWLQGASWLWPDALPRKEFQDRVRPTEVLTLRERSARRMGYLLERIAELESEGDYRQVEELLDIDTADDGAWRLREVDPAPPPALDSAENRSEDSPVWTPRMQRERERRTNESLFDRLVAADLTKHQADQIRNRAPEADADWLLAALEYVRGHGGRVAGDLAEELEVRLSQMGGNDA